MLRRGSLPSWWFPNRSQCIRCPRRTPHLQKTSSQVRLNFKTLTISRKRNRTNVRRREVSLALKEEQADIVVDIGAVVALVQFHLEVGSIENKQVQTSHLSHSKGLLVWILTIELMTPHHNAQV